jgi:hypothetical protein
MLADFGQRVIFSPGATWPNRSDKTVTIQAVYDNDFLEMPGLAGVESSGPVLVGRTSDLSDAAHNSMIELENGDKFKVVSPQHDGTGITLLQLEGPR